MLDHICQTAFVRMHLSNSVEIKLNYNRIQNISKNISHIGDPKQLNIQNAKLPIFPLSHKPESRGNLVLIHMITIDIKVTLNVIITTLMRVKLRV